MNARINIDNSGTIDRVVDSPQIATSGAFQLVLES